MSMLQYVSLDIARTATGTRLVTSALVASPWSEAAKGLFEVAKRAVLVVRRSRDATDVTAWTGADNVPVVMHDDEPPRTNWAAIVGLVDRLAGAPLVPSGVHARAQMFGVLDSIAGENGLGYNARFAMIDASLSSNGERGFALPVATYLARRYGYVPLSMPAVKLRVSAQLALLSGRLGDARYFGGDVPCAVDVYAATFLTPLSRIDAAACPQMSDKLRHAFASAHDAFGAEVAANLWTHRERMFQHHLPWPIAL